MTIFFNDGLTCTPGQPTIVQPNTSALVLSIDRNEFDVILKASKLQTITVEYKNPGSIAIFFHTYDKDKTQMMCTNQSTTDLLPSVGADENTGTIEFYYSPQELAVRIGLRGITFTDRQGKKVVLPPVEITTTPCFSNDPEQFPFACAP